MKSFLSLLLLLTCWQAFAQQATPAPLPIDSKTHRITYSDKVLADGVSQQDFLNHALSWADQRSNAAKLSSLAMEHIDSAVVFAGTEEMVYPTLSGVVTQRLHYKATLLLSEGSYWYRFTDFEVEIAGIATSPAQVYVPVETFLAQNPPANALPNHAYLVRTAFEEATAELVGALQADLASHSSSTQIH
jgi:hypothetical protein